MPAFSPNKLPPELWHLIFGYATALYSTPQRFRPYPRELDDLRQARQYGLKRSLVLVCKLWNAIALPLLYQIVWIDESRWNTGRWSLQPLVESAGYGKWVRHIVLPEFGFSDSWEVFEIVNFLKFCPDIQTLWRLQYSVHPLLDGLFAPILNSMTSLRYVHWTFSYPIQPESREVIRMNDILRHAPNLRSLSIRCASHLVPGSQLRTCLGVPLTSLTTLEYCGDIEQLVLLHEDMPNLTHVIATPNLHPTTPKIFPVLSVFGQQLKMIEFPNTPVPFDAIFDHCPNLHTLGYNIHLVVFPTTTTTTTTVLHPSISVILLTTQKIPDDDAFEKCLAMHIKTLTGKAFPALRKVVLEGSAEGMWIDRDSTRRTSACVRGFPLSVFRVLPLSGNADRCLGRSWHVVRVWLFGCGIVELGISDVETHGWDSWTIYKSDHRPLFLLAKNRLECRPSLMKHRHRLGIQHGEKRYWWWWWWLTQAGLSMYHTNAS